ncbi:RICIN domain-containing protein [Streptomyces sp. NPDC002536]
MKILPQLTALATAATAVVVLTPSTGQAVESNDLQVNLSSQKCLEIENSSKADGARAQQWACKGQPGSHWRIQWETGGVDGTFMLVNKNSEKCLEIADSRKDVGAPAQQWTCKPHYTNQLWYFWKSPKPNSHLLVNLNSNQVLEITYPAVADGAPARQWLQSDTAIHQMWTGAPVKQPASVNGPARSR